MEAMASGLPVVAMKNRGHCALVKDGETGFLVQSEAQMTEKVRTLLRDPALYRRCGAAALERVRQYDVQRVLSELAQLYFE